MIVLPIIGFLTAYAAIPEKITVMQGQRLNFNGGITVSAETEKTGNYSCCAKLFNFIPIKTVSVSVMPVSYVIPSGESIGVRVYADGIIVVGMGDVSDEYGRKLEPAKKAGIKVGDRIVEAGGCAVKSTEEFAKLINASDKAVNLRVVRGDDILNIDVETVYSKERGSRKIGLWVRDSAAGIGTLTFYNPENSTFAALGHGICDSDTKELIAAQKGFIGGCRIRSAQRGKSGAPGELIGDFYGGSIGDITTNCNYGIFGKAEFVPNKKAVEVASRFQTKEGMAQILCDVDGNGPAVYKVEITKISRAANETGKSFVIKVTDESLLQKTGGIVQGMSGSPILQNGRLIGAVTHVCVNL